MIRTVTKTRIMIKTKPPTTPPTIAPVFEDPTGEESSSVVTVASNVIMSHSLELATRLLVYSPVLVKSLTRIASLLHYFLSIKNKKDTSVVSRCKGFKQNIYTRSKR